MPALLQLSLRQLTGRWRVLLLVLLAALPVGLMLLLTLIQGEDETSNEGYANFVDGLLISVVLPVISLVLATVLFGNELEDKTLSYLVLTPLPRFGIVLAKFAAAIAVAGPLVVASGILATWLGEGSFGAKLVVVDSSPRAVAAVGIALLMGSIAYSALFMWVGLMTTRALPYALVYVVLWEGVIASFFEGIRYISVRGYTLGVVHGLDEASFADLSGRAIGLPAAFVGIAGVTLVFVYLTVRRLRQMDVP